MAGFVRQRTLTTAGPVGGLKVEPVQESSPYGVEHIGSLDDLKTGLNRSGHTDVSPSRCFLQLQEIGSTVERYLLLLESLLDHERVMEQLRHEASQD